MTRFTQKNDAGRVVPDNALHKLNEAAEGAARELREEAKVCDVLARSLRAQAAARRRYASRCRAAARVETMAFRVPMWKNECAVAMQEAEQLEHEAEAKELRRDRLVEHAALLGARWS